MEKFWTQMSFEEREAHYKSLRIAARREIERWETESKMKWEKESESKFRSQWESKKVSDEAHSSARRSSGADVPSWGGHTTWSW